MKLEDIKETMTGSSDLDCMVELKPMNNKIFFIDDTRGIFTEVDSQSKLDKILESNIFASTPTQA